MELKQGYKQTELGIIPENWDVKNLGELGEVKMCKRIFSYQTKSHGDIPFFKIGTFGKEPDSFITNELYNNYRQRFSFPQKGTLLISAAGTIGRTIVYDGQPSYFQDSNIVWIENDEKKISNSLLFHILQTVNYNTEGGTIQRLYNSILKSTKFIYPAKAEQTAIANGLSNIDELIAQTEYLIDKKKAIKQGVIQELLKPKEGWEYTKLGNICLITKGQLITDTTRVNGDIPVIAGGRTPAYYHNLPNRLGKTITISGSGASAGYVAFHDYPIFASDCSTISESLNYDIEFIYYWLQLNQNKIYKKQTGGAQPHIHPSDLNPMEICVPNISKQKEISVIITDLDSEISSYETKVTKLKHQKQGMMQALLTGKIRLL
jgi:type I restriction enzyme S subunit